MSKLSKIEPECWYSLREIVEGRFFASITAPWQPTYQFVRQIVRDDRTAANILGAKMRGKGTNVRYLIKGENIIKFIKNHE